MRGMLLIYASTILSMFALKFINGKWPSFELMLINSTIAYITIWRKE